MQLGSQLDMQAFTPLFPLSAQAGTGEGEQAGLEFGMESKNGVTPRGRG